MGKGAALGGGQDRVCPCPGTGGVGETGSVPALTPGGARQGLSPLWHQGQQPVNCLGLATVHGHTRSTVAAAWPQNTTRPGFQS